eukprot:scaffold44129_cov61-Phaeocystis_antarctica.AAC.4
MKGLQEHDGEAAVVRSNHQRGEPEAARQVYARASLQQLPHHLQVAVGCGGVQQADGCGLSVTSWNTAECVDRPSFAQPADHLLQLALLGCKEDLGRQQGGRAHRGLASFRWGGSRDGGRLWRRCLLPDALRGGWLALNRVPLRCGAAVHVDQLSGGPGE